MRLWPIQSVDDRRADTDERWESKNNADSKICWKKANEALLLRKRKRALHI